MAAETMGSSDSFCESRMDASRPEAATTFPCCQGGHLIDDRVMTTPPQGQSGP